jgi:hypothetical protein
MTLITIHRDEIAFKLWTGRLSPGGASSRVERMSPRVGAEQSSKWTNWPVAILVGTMGVFLYLTRPNQEGDQ